MMSRVLLPKPQPVSYHMVSLHALSYKAITEVAPIASPMQSDTTSRPSQSHNSPPGHLRPNSADCYAEVGSQVSDHNNESVIPAQYNSSPSSPGMVEVGGEQAVAEDGLLNETGKVVFMQHVLS